MKKTLLILYSLLLCVSFNSCFSQIEKTNQVEMKYNELNDDEKRVILNKGTDRPFTGEYTDLFEEGTYICRQCNSPLYKSADKFHSGCGWPSFDNEIEGAVVRVPDADGRRTEIICANCKGHLGHVFEGEKLTDKNVRHCVNTTSMIFVKKEKASTEKHKKAIYAGGCFWGVEYYFQNEKGVVSTQVGYTGGNVENPSYKEVCGKKTGHYEALEVTYDPNVTDYITLTKLFFEIHDPTQWDGQGNDIGPQYQSAIFYTDDNQKKTADSLIDVLKTKGIIAATKLYSATKFYPAEDYHQQYYENKGGTPYCHFKKKIF